MKTIELKGADLEIAGLQQDEEASGLLSKQNVVGVGVGRKTRERTGEVLDQPCLTVLVTHKMDASELSDQDRVPAHAGKFETDVLTVGHLFAGGAAAPMPVARRKNGKSRSAGPYELPPMAPQPPLDAPAEPLDLGPALEAGIEVLTRKVRPALGGYSVAHPNVTAGTIATGVVDGTALPGVPNKYYLLSNNHVLANSNAARIGDPILQPGPYDGGTFADVIGRLSRFVPIRFDGSANLVDAAIAEVPFHDLNREIFWIGYPSKQIASVQVGQPVQKTGRTTNYTQGRVSVLNATVDVNYGGGRVARFVRQIVTTAMSAGGDSGSLVLDLDDRPIGLLFAGSSVSTIINPIAYVQSLLNVRVGF